MINRKIGYFSEKFRFCRIWVRWKDFVALVTFRSWLVTIRRPKVPQIIAVLSFHSNGHFSLFLSIFILNPAQLQLSFLPPHFKCNCCSSLSLFLLHSLSSCMWVLKAISKATKLTNLFLSSSSTSWSKFGKFSSTSFSLISFLLVVNALHVNGFLLFSFLGIL